MKRLDEREFDAKNPALDRNFTVDASSTNILGDMDESEIDEGGPPEENETPVSRRFLSKQTLDGIRMTTLAFKPLIVFL